MEKKPENKLGGIIYRNNDGTIRQVNNVFGSWVEWGRKSNKVFKTVSGASRSMAAAGYTEVRRWYKGRDEK